MSILSITGIALGVASLMVVISVMMGFDREQRKRILESQPHVILTPKKPGLNPEKSASQVTHALAEKLKRMPEVTSVEELERKDILLRSDSGVYSAELITTSVAQVSRLLDRSRERYSYADGSSVSLQDMKPYDVILEEGLASRLGVVPGDFIQDIDLRESDGPFGLIPALNSYRVLAVLPAYVGANESERLPPIYVQGDVRAAGNTQIELMLKSPEKAEQFKAAQSKLSPHYDLSTWQDRNRRLLQSLRLERLGMSVAIFFVVIVAALNLVTGLSLQVIRRKRELAILQTFGAESKFIYSVFVRVGLILGGLGVSFGVVLGLLCLRLIATQGGALELPEVYYDRSLPVEYMPMTYLTTVICAMFVVWLVSYLPAIRAARTGVIQGLKRLS